VWLFGKPCLKQYVLWPLTIVLGIGIFFSTWQLAPLVPKAVLKVNSKTPRLHAYLADGGILVTNDGPSLPHPRIELWDTGTGKKRISITDSNWNAMASPDGSVFTMLDSHTDLKMWETGTGKEIPEFVAFQEEAGCLRQNATRFSPDSRFFIVEHSMPEGTVFLLFWEVGTKTLKLCVKAHLSDLRIAANGQQMVILHKLEDGQHIQLERWHLDAGFPSHGPFQVHDVDAYCVAISPQFDTFASARHNEDPTKDDVQLWDMATGRQRAEVVAPQWCYDLQFNTDGSFLRAGGKPNGGEPVWDAKAELKQVGSFCDLIHISADGRWFLVSMILMDSTTSHSRGTISTRGGASAISFAPDNSSLLATRVTSHVNCNVITRFLGSYVPVFEPRDEEVVRLWDVETAKEIGTFVDCSQALYSPDGKTLATAHSDGTIKVWDIPPRKPLLRIAGLSVALWLLTIVGLQVLQCLLGWWFSRRPHPGLTPPPPPAQTPAGPCREITP
jgi:WD40 repeat protein